MIPAKCQKLFHQTTADPIQQPQVSTDQHVEMSSTEDLIWKWKYVAGSLIGLFGLALLVNSCRSAIPRFRLRQRPKAKLPRERDVELGNISEGTVAEPEPEPDAGDEPVEDLDGADVVTLGEKQRFVAGKLGASLDCPHRNGTALPPGYNAATRLLARQTAASRESVQEGQTPASASGSGPLEHDQAIGTHATSGVSVPPPTYDASDPHPRSERRYVSFIKISRDVEALSILRDASESA